MNRNRTSIAIIAAAGAVIAASTAQAGVHTWDVNEVFSSADGLIQYIELKETAGGVGEINLAGRLVTSETTGNQFVFPANLVPPPSLKHLLLATQSFADLPGAPTPDHIIPPNFFSTAGDTLRFHTVDTWVIAPGAIPTDCVSSLDRITGAGVNSPTNYDGGSGSVDAWPQRIADINDDNVVDTADLGALIAQFGTVGPSANLNGDDIVDTADLGILIAAFGSACP